MSKASNSIAGPTLSPFALKRVLGDSKRDAESILASTPSQWHSPRMTTSELLQSALALSPTDRIKLAAKLLESIAPGEVVATSTWESDWLAEVEQREALEPEDGLSAENELPAVRRRLAGLFR